MYALRTFFLALAQAAQGSLWLGNGMTSKEPSADVKTLLSVILVSNLRRDFRCLVPGGGSQLIVSIA